MEAAKLMLYNRRSHKIPYLDSSHKAQPAEDIAFTVSMLWKYDIMKVNVHTGSVVVNKIVEERSFEHCVSIHPNKPFTILNVPL
jgi:hypothetical protein